MNTEIKVRQLGIRIAERLKDKRLTQKELAEMLGASPSTISQICTGKTAITISWLYEIAELLDTTTAYLTDGVVGPGVVRPKKQDIESMHGLYKRKVIDSELYIQFLEKKLDELAE